MKSTDPTLGSDDCLPLRSILGDRRVIGLGEATNGTREFFQLKHRLIRFLVQEVNLRLIGFESNFSETIAINEYVLDGEGDPKSALEGIYFWTWNTEEVLALLEWLRAFNAERPRSDRVRFYGFDAQYTSGAVGEIRAFLRRVDPDYLDRVEAALEAVDDDGLPAARDDDIAERIEAADKLVSALEDRLSERESEYVASAGREAWELARQHVRTIVQAYKRKRAMDRDDLEEAMAVRDEAMAENVEWILDHEASDRIVLWAHNDHVNRIETRAVGDAAPSMGSHLADRFGEDYYAMGFEFGRGAFQALAHSDDDPENGEYELQEHVLETPMPETVGRTMTDLERPVVVLDFNAARADPRLREWLESAQRIHSIGAVYAPEDSEHHAQAYNLAEAFDGLCFVDSTSRARPLEEPDAAHAE